MVRKGGTLGAIVEPKTGPMVSELSLSTVVSTPGLEVEPRAGSRTRNLPGRGELLNGGILGWMVENGGGAAVVKESPDAEVTGDGVVNTVVSVARMPELVDLFSVSSSSTLGLGVVVENRFRGRVNLSLKEEVTMSLDGLVVFSSEPESFSACGRGCLVEKGNLNPGIRDRGVNTDLGVVSLGGILNRFGLVLVSVSSSPDPVTGLNPDRGGVNSRRGGVSSPDVLPDLSAFSRFFVNREFRFRLKRLGRGRLNRFSSGLVLDSTA